MIAKLKSWIDAFPLPNEAICLGIGVVVGIVGTLLADWLVF